MSTKRRTGGKRRFASSNNVQGYAKVLKIGTVDDERKEVLHPDGAELPTVVYFISKS